MLTNLTAIVGMVEGGRFRKSSLAVSHARTESGNRSMPLSAESKHGDLWINLQERHAGHRFLKQNPLYTLKTDLIHAIKSECPNFFSTADERFEFDLAQTAHHGFFCHLPIGNNFNQSAIPEQIEPPPEASSGGFLPSRIEAFAPKEAQKRNRSRYGLAAEGARRYSCSWHGCISATF